MVRRIAAVLLVAVTVAGCGGGNPISRSALEHRLERESRQNGESEAKASCKRDGDRYRCVTVLGAGGIDGALHESFTLSGRQTGESSLAVQ